MPRYDCKITETFGDSWPIPGTTTRDYSYEGETSMDGYTDSMVDSKRVWKCKKSDK